MPPPEELQAFKPPMMPPPPMLADEDDTDNALNSLLQGMVRSRGRPSSVRVGWGACPRLGADDRA